MKLLDKQKMDFSTGGWLIMSQPNGFLILRDHLLLNYIFLGGAEGVDQYRGVEQNPNLTYTWHIENY